MAHPDFGRIVNPTSTRGDRLCPPNYFWHTRIFRASDGPGMEVPLDLTYSSFDKFDFFPAVQVYGAVALSLTNSNQFIKEGNIYFWRSTFTLLQFF